MYFGNVRTRRIPAAYRLPPRIVEGTEWLSGLGDFGTGTATVNTIAKQITTVSKDIPGQLADLKQALTITTAASLAAGLGVAFLLLRTRGLGSRR